MAGDCCGTCRFYGAEIGEGAGACRRYPPVLVVSLTYERHLLIFEGVCDDYRFPEDQSNVWSQPMVLEDSWCGEFKEREDDGN